MLRILKALFIGFVIGCIIFAIWFFFLKAKPVFTEPVTVTGGQVFGEEIYHEDVYATEYLFKGLPFAAPPVGDLRWRAPAPVIPWEGVRDGTKFGNRCMQYTGTEIDPPEGGFIERIMRGHGKSEFDIFWINTLLGKMPAAPTSEDCLFLNVRTRDMNSDAKQPVMLWIHGGSHLYGAGSDMLYQSENLTARGVVLVTVNYRLDNLGYLAHPALAAENEYGAAGNYGTMDHIAALEWVRDNIATFGGDPNNVTIFGESAGSWSVSELMATPKAKGLFHRAISQSGFAAGHLGSAHHKSHELLPHLDAMGHGAETATLLGLDGANATAAELRAIPAEELVRLPVKTNGKYFSANQSIADGHIFPVGVGGTFLLGQQNKVPYMAGYNADEGTTLYSWVNSATQYRATDGNVQMVDDIITPLFGAERSAKLQELYGFTGQGGEHDKAVHMWGDDAFGAPTRMALREHVRAGQPAYGYFFSRIPGHEKQTVGAFHAAEIPFVFDTHNVVLEKYDGDDHLIDAMQTYWTNFAKTGNPNLPDLNGLPVWPAYMATADNAKGDYWMELNHSPQAIENLRKNKLDILEENLREIIMATPSVVEAFVPEIETEELEIEEIHTVD